MVDAQAPRGRRRTPEEIPVKRFTIADCRLPIEEPKLRIVDAVIPAALLGVATVGLLIVLHFIFHP